MTEPAPHTPPSFDALVERVLAGDSKAWSRLMAEIHPTLMAICQRRRLGDRRWSWEDTYRDVALCAIGRIHANDFAALRSYVATRAKYPNVSFRAWLGTIVSHTYVDYLRAQPELQRQRQGALRTLVALQRVELDCETRPDPRAGDIETQVEIRRIMSALLEPRFPAAQRRALLLWLQGVSASEIRDEMQLASIQDAHRLLRAARQRLRRAFSHEGNQ